MPQEPPLTPWQFPPATEADGHGVVGVGADLEPGTLLAAYRNGVFPMPIPGRRRIAWWSPDPRGILPLDGLVLSRSLRRSVRRYSIRFDTAFADVVRCCAAPGRDGAWISPEIQAAYIELHRLGWAHSVEAWDDERDALVGGLYGVKVAGLFAGESMFHDQRDASKVALVALVDRLRGIGADLLDVQWLTPHLASLGAIEIRRQDYLRRLSTALQATTDGFEPPAPPHRSS
ncbi:MAG TPA: leucyl/phenylalanyl-tRNA--protein transferase [Acidimicrobiales bacterium]